MARLTSKRRKALPGSKFLLPGRRYPDDTPGRARAALSYGSRYATPAEDAKIKRGVKRDYPKMKVRGSKRGR